MAALYHPSESDVSLEVGEYRQFSKPDPDYSTIEKTQQPSVKYIHVVLLSFGLLCTLQAALNITLRLLLHEIPEKGETQEEEICPPDWLMFQSSCYFISSQRGSWDQGRQDCLQREADLVIVNTTQEEAFLIGFTEAAWVGMTDHEKEGVWLWVDGTAVDRNGLKWAPGQPDDAFNGEDCGDLRTMINFIGLNDSDCKQRVQWICEKTIR